MLVLRLLRLDRSRLRIILTRVIRARYVFEVVPLLLYLLHSLQCLLFLHQTNNTIKQSTARIRRETLSTIQRNTCPKNL
jgi:hypothetical protein